MSIHGGVHVKYRGHNLIGVNFKGGLRGAVAARAAGRGVHLAAVVRRLLARQHRARRWRSGVSAPVIASLVPLLADELDNAANLTVARRRRPARAGDAAPEPHARPVLSPLAAPTWSQNRLPLGMPIETFEDGQLDEPQRLDVTASRPTTSQLDWFTPGSFVELSDAEEMALPSFEQHQAGVVVSADGTRSASVTRTVLRSRRSGCPTPPHHRPGFPFPGHVLDRLDAVDGDVTMRPRPTRFAVRDVGLEVDAAGAVMATGATAVQARLVARSSDGAVQHPADRLVEV